MEKKAPPPRVKVPPATAVQGAILESGVTFDLLDNLTGAPPRQPTRVTIARDQDRVCIQFQCEDAEPWATIERRDGPLYQEETVEVFLDPFGDLECYFEIEVNPLNAVLDLMLRRVGKGWRKEFGWACQGLETSVACSTIGWHATLAIPFTAIAPSPPVPGTLWRANFLRIDRPPGAPRELSAWSPTGIETFHVPTRFGFLEF